MAVDETSDGFDNSHIRCVVCPPVGKCAADELVEAGIQMATELFETGDLMVYFFLSLLIFFLFLYQEGDVLLNLFLHPPVLRRIDHSGNMISPGWSRCNTQRSRFGQVSDKPPQLLWNSWQSFLRVGIYSERSQFRQAVAAKQALEIAEHPSRALNDRINVLLIACPASCSSPLVCTEIVLERNTGFHHRHQTMSKFLTSDVPQKLFRNSSTLL